LHTEISVYNNKTIITISNQLTIKVTEAAVLGWHGSLPDNVCSVPRFTTEQPVNNVTGCKAEQVITDITWNRTTKTLLTHSSSSICPRPVAGAAWMGTCCVIGLLTEASVECVT